MRGVLVRLSCVQRCIAESKQRLEAGGGNGEDLLTCLCDLFHTISTQRKRCGVLPPRKFVAKLREENEIFNNYMHQDAHEFLNYLLNEAAEILEKRSKAAGEGAGGGSTGRSAGRSTGGGCSTTSYAAGADSGADSGEEDGEVTEDDGSSPEDDERDGLRPATSDGDGGAGKTWIHKIFEGLLTNETRCLSCDSVTSRDESFLDLSLEIQPNSSVSACLRNFSAVEPLRGDNKFFCDTCCSLQEANKRMRIKRLPNVLALHLKRFKCARARAQRAR